MTSLKQAARELGGAYEARDASRKRAREVVDNQFKAIIALRERTYRDACDAAAAP